jgi:general stress protein 26
MSNAVVVAEATHTIELAMEIAHRTVWAMMTTVDDHSRPRSRVVHPVWTLENGAPLGWLTTRKTPLKTRHLATNPHVSLAYMAANHDLAYFDCTAEWADEPENKQRCWHAFLDAPEPARYDPATIWPDGPDSPDFAVLRFQPYRIQAGLAADVAAGRKLRIARLCES